MTPRHSEEGQNATNERESAMDEKFPISGDVRISGIINDEEFSATGEAAGDPVTGRYQVTLNYTSIPKGWHPFMYTDVKVSLLFLKEEGGAQNFLSLANGVYQSAGTIDLGNGNLLKNNTNIRMLNKNRFTAVYVMCGTAHTGDLNQMEFFEETLLPFGPGRIAAIAMARWKSRSGEVFDALFSTRYIFDSKKELKRPQFRRVNANATLKASKTGGTFRASYTGFVRPLPRGVEEGGPYIGHLIA
jgi:hypothetical protein